MDTTVLEKTKFKGKFAENGQTIALDNESDEEDPA